MMRPRIYILGDQISDVYIDNININQNQEIIDTTSYKGYYDNIKVRAGGTGFVILNLLELVNNNNSFIIKYLLPDFNRISYNDELPAFNLNALFDMSLKYMYEQYNKEYFHIIKMQPIDYLSDIIKPTVKMRFYSKENKKIYFRFDNDNSICMRNINCTNLFDKSSITNNNLVIIDYNKGYFNQSTIKSLYGYIESNGLIFNRMFLNTKPSQLKYFIELLNHLHNCKTEIIIQLNESEFEPIKHVLKDFSWTYMVVTRGKESVHLYENGSTPIKYEFDVSKIVMDDMYTTSGCGDMFLANMIYNMLYKTASIHAALKELTPMKKLLTRLNHDLFE